MASATAKTLRKVTEETTVTLTLDANEAVTLTAILANVSGPRDGSPREHVSAIYKALDDAGARYGGSAAYKAMQGSIHFKAYPSGFKGESLAGTFPFTSGGLY